MFRNRAAAVRLLLAAASAVTIWAAAPGLWQVPALVWIGLLPLMAAISRKRGRAAFGIGFLFGLIFNLLLIYWVVVAMHRFGGMSFATAALALILLASYLALFPALFCLFVARARSSPWLVLLAPTVWVGLDWLRGVLLTGFPWMDLAYDLYRQPKLIQAASFFGHQLITFVIVLVNFIILELITSRRRHGSVFQRTVIPMLVAATIVLVFSGINLGSYHHTRKLIAAAPTKKVAIVQGNIPQDEKWRPQFQQKTLATYIKMSLTAAKKQPQLIVWPETAMPGYPRESGLWQLAMDALISPTGIPVVFGAPHREKKDGRIDYFNSAFIADATGITGRYDKEHLVPFGEYVPLRRMLFFLSPIVDSIGDFTAGSNGRPLTCGTIRLGLLICFETIFPDLVVKRVTSGSDLLIDLTNDAWYGRTSAPWQDLAMATFRAVENRRSLARAANTGFSGFVDPLGRSHKISPLFKPYVAVYPLPLLRTKSIMTFYGGHFFGVLCFIAGLVIIIPFCRRKNAYGIIA